MRMTLGDFETLPDEILAKEESNDAKHQLFALLAQRSAIRDVLQAGTR